MTNPFESLVLEPAQKNENVHKSTVKLIDKFGKYEIGEPKRPDIKHDNGFLDHFPKREPTASDRAKLALWKSALEGAEVACDETTGEHLPLCNGDNADGLAAYRHFLYGNGADRTINYERYIQNDPSGKVTLKSIIKEFQTDVEQIGKNRINFSVTSGEYRAGQSKDLPYPQTTNWVRAIGAHSLWISADVSVSVNEDKKITYDADITLHAEDMYNFNPNSADISTGIPDAANGIFEITGLAKQYMNYGTVTRHIRWVEGNHISVNISGQPSERQRKPQDNRRLRNKI